MTAFPLAFLVLVLLLPGAAASEELRFGIRVGQNYDSNIQNTASDEEDEFFLRVTPHIELQDRGGDLRWRVRYAPSYELFYSETDLNGWDHVVLLDADLQLTPQTSVSLAERFASTQSTTSFNETTLVDGATTADVVLGRRRINRNNVGLELVHRLSLASSLSFSLDHSFRDDDAENTSDVNSFSAGTRFTSAWTERDVIGAGFTFTRQHFDGTDLRNSQDTDFYNAYGFLEHRFDPTLRVTLTAGPALIDGGESADSPTLVNNVQQYPLVNGQFVLASSCPVEGGQAILDTGLANSQCGSNPQSALSPPGAGVVSSVRINGLPFAGGGSVSNTNLTWFANASITKAWETWSAQLSFRRNTSVGSNVTSEIVDSLRTNLNWRPTPRWNLDLSGAFIRRTQASDTLVSVAVIDPTVGESIAVPPGFFPNPLPVPDGSARTVGFRTVKLDNDLEVLQYLAEFNTSYRLQERLTVFGRFYYQKQQPDGDIQITRDTDVFRVGFGFSYEFDPVLF